MIVFMKKLMLFLITFSTCSFSMESDIFYDIFHNNKIYKTPSAIDYCESHSNEGWGCDYLSAVKRYDYGQEVASGEFNPIYRIQSTNISDYTGSNHSIPYIPVKIVNESVMLKLDTATSETIINATGDIPMSPFKSPFYEDYGENFGLFIADVEGETFKIKGKNFYTTASDNNIAGQDLIETLGGIELSLLSIRPDPKDYDCDDTCKKFDIKRRNGKWYISYDLGAGGIDFVLDTGSEISTLTNKIDSDSCYQVKADFYTEIRSNKNKVDHIDFCEIDFISENIDFVNGVKIYDGFDGVLGANFFNSFRTVVFDTRNWRLFLFR